MSSTAPPTRPSTATSTNGTRYHVGKMVDSAPIGSVLMADDSDADDPASSTPKPSRNSGAMDEPNVVHHTTPAPEDRRGREREESAPFCTQPRPKPVATRTVAPRKACGDPECSEDTVAQWILGMTRMKYTTVST